MGSVLGLEVGGLGLARNFVQRYALDTCAEQGFGIDEKVAHHCFGRPDNAAFDIAGRPRGNLIWRTPTHWLAHFRYYMVS